MTSDFVSLTTNAHATPNAAPPRRSKKGQVHKSDAINEYLRLPSKKKKGVAKLRPATNAVESAPLLSEQDWDDIYTVVEDAMNAEGQHDLLSQLEYCHPCEEASMNDKVKDQGAPSDGCSPSQSNVDECLYSVKPDPKVSILLFAVVF